MHDFLLAFFAVASLHFLGVAAPGPDFALVTKNALLYPRRQAVYTAAGIALGLSVHITYCILGLAIVIAESPLLFNLMKYLGAGYLIYIGVQCWRAEKTSQASATSQTTISDNAQITISQALRQGFLCNVLNPKATLFFLGLFSVVIKPTTPLWQQLFFGVWMIGMTFAWFAFIACLITHPHTRQKIARAQFVIVKVMAVLFIMMGVLLVFWSYR